LNAKICPYCKSETKIVSETEIYGKEYKGRKMICCKNFPKCDSYVGTHDDETTLGRLANKLLRSRKKQAHFYFDKIWNEKLVDRNDLYDDLADFLGLTFRSLVLPPVRLLDFGGSSRLLLVAGRIIKIKYN
jgi:hypothetical protein